MTRQQRWRVRVTMLIALLVAAVMPSIGSAATPDGPLDRTTMVAVESPDTAVSLDEDCPPNAPHPPGPNAGIPSLPCLPATTALGNTVWDYGMGLDPAFATVERQKLEIRLPPQTIRVYLAQCFALGTIWTDPNCADIGASRGWVLPTGFDFWQGQTGEAWVESPPGSEMEFGTFPPVRVRSLGFGAVPVEATAHITQTVTDGLIDPLVYEWMSSSADLSAGTVIPGYESHGPSPGSPNGVFAFPSTISGSVQIRLSNVVVDGVAVEIGDTCQTPPTPIRLGNEPGWFDDAKQKTGEIEVGEPGAWSGTASGVGVAKIHGTLDIPGFKGCKAGGEDLSPLVTGLVSGPDNYVVVTNATGVPLWCTDVTGPGADWGQMGSVCPGPSQVEGIQASAGVMAAHRSMTANPLAALPRKIRDKMTPAQRKEYEQLVREAYPTPEP